MSTPSILGLAGGSLARRMLPVDDDAPTLTNMPAVGSNPSVLPWQTDFRVELTLPGGAFVFASVMRADVSHLVRGDRLSKPWSAYCAVNADESFKDWFPTAEEARAAVEEHIAAHIEAQLNEGAK